MIASPHFNFHRCRDQSVMWKLNDTPERCLLNRLQRKLEHPTSAVRNHIRVDQFEETFVAPNSARNLFVNFDEFRFLAQAAFKIHRRTEKFSVLCPRSSWRR